MEANKALGIAAQVAVTLAGFAGVVVAFRPDSVHVLQFTRTVLLFPSKE